MQKQFKPVYNLYFLVPFILWVLAGIFLLPLNKDQHLFQVVNSHHTPFLDWFMYGATNLGDGNYITAALLLLTAAVATLQGWRFRKAAASQGTRAPLKETLKKAFSGKFWWFFGMSAACNALPALLVQAVKLHYAVYRPLVYFKGAPWLHILPTWKHLYENSFPSGHSAGSFSFFCYLSLLLFPRYKAWGTSFCCLALLTCYTRLYVAAHFYTDVYAGSIIGTITTLLIFNIINYVWPYRTSPTFDESN